MLLYTILGLVITVGAFLGLGWYLIAKDNAKLDKLLMDFDEKYERLVDYRVNTAFIESENGKVEVEHLTQEIVEMLKPELEALIFHADQMNNSSNEFNPEKTKYFKNIAGILNTLLSQKKKTDEATLQKIQASFHTSIHSDIKQRLLFLK